MGYPLSPRLDFREHRGRLIDKVAFDPYRINSAHQRADSWERLYPDKGTPLMMRVTGLSLLGNLSLITVSGLCGALGLLTAFR